MNKNDVLQQLREAKLAHINWVQRAKMLISGFEIGEDSIPVNSTQCQFGKWFYSDAQKLNAMQNNPLECMQTIEQLHFDLHDTYMHIYKIYYDLKPKGFFSKLFGKRKKVSESEIEIAKRHFEQMQEISAKLVDELNRMERRVVAIQEKEFEGI